MLNVLEEIAEERSSIKVVERREYSAKNNTNTYNKNYSTFAEMYLERPADPQGSIFTCTVCTWKNVPTIDDW